MAAAITDGMKNLSVKGEKLSIEDKKSLENISVCNPILL